MSRKQAISKISGKYCLKFETVVRMATKCKVLFIAGLESGRSGAKSQNLSKHFDQVHSIDLQVSMFRGFFSKRHCVLRNVLFHPISIAFAVTFYLLNIIRSPQIPAPAFYISCFAIFLFVISKVISRVVLGILENCVDIQAQEIIAFQPQVIVSSSFGAAIALLLIDRKMWSGKTILIAPALNQIFKFTKHLNYIDFCSELPKDVAKGTICFHGTSDKTIPFTDSEVLVRYWPCTLEAIEGGDHKLNDKLLKTNRLAKTVMNLVLQSEHQSRL